MRLLAKLVGTAHKVSTVFKAAPGTDTVLGITTLFDLIVDTINTNTSLQVSPSARTNLLKLVIDQYGSISRGEPLSVGSLAAYAADVEFSKVTFEKPECVCPACDCSFDPREAAKSFGRGATIVHLEAEHVENLEFLDPSGKYSGTVKNNIIEPVKLQPKQN
jgi:hypothetical protein